MRSLRLGAGETTSLRPRRAVRAAAAVAAAALLAVALGSGVAARGARPASTVGRDLGRLDGPRVEPVLVPARVARVAVVPGSEQLEAWAYGHTHWREEGYSQTDPQGQAVLLSYRQARGWRIEQPLLDAEGRPASPGVTALDIAPGGEGWGVGQTGLLFHRPPGKRWQIHAQSGAVANVSLSSVSLGRDGEGVYGWAVGPGPTFLRLADGSWAHDIGSVRGSGGTGDVLGNVVSVAAVDRQVAYAVAAGPRELVLYRRDAMRGWERIQTGQALFDVAPSVQPVSGGSPVVNQFSRGASVAAAGGAVWVTGSIQPVDSTRYVNQRGPGADPQRPFALRIDADGAITSFCPRIYQLSSGGVTSTSALCDQPFPLAAGGLPALEVLPNGDAIAGGFGVFRYTRGRWAREPNVAGQVASLAFHSQHEGWIGSYGNRSSEGGGLAASTSPTLGHWTTGAAEPSMIRRWPHPSRQTLEGVVLNPDGSGEALAVGGGGEIVRFEPGVGWDVVASPTQRALHHVAWPAPRRAWAVGAEGTILRFDGSRWREDPASRDLTPNAIYRLAFRGPSDGIAVGAKGTILRYDGARWRLDRQSGLATEQRLMGLAFAGDDAIAVGERSTILVDDGGGWKVDATAPDRFKTLQEGRAPSLFTVAGLPDGRAFIGGELSILLERRPGGRFERARSVPMLSGAVLALGAVGSGARPQLVASIATEPTGRVNKYGGSGLIEPTGWMYATDGAVWRSVGEQRVADYLDPDIDAGLRRDAVYDLAVGPDGRGFAVGGFPPDLQDDDGHQSSLPSGSIWRLAVDGRPEGAPNHSRVSVRAARGSIGFAFLADTACSAGLCSAAAGTGARADEILARALADVDAAVASGDVRFAAFGGDFRRLGLPDELASIRGMLDSLSVPAFAALGDQDLFGGVNAAGESLLASNGYYLAAFADRAAPWGHAPPIPGFVPVQVAGEPAADPTLARTHYAFDYTLAGRPVLRMVFLDTSRSTQEITFQNPPADQDSAWLRPLLNEAASLGLPAIVVMHQPLLASLGTGGRAGTLTAALAGTGIEAVLASHERVNRFVTYLDPVTPYPVAILGSTGGALAQGWKPTAGAYHAWFHVSVPLGGDGSTSIRSIPVLESVAVSAPQGRTAGAGTTLRFTGLARLPDTGGNDPQQDRAQYLSFPMPRPCGGPFDDPERTGCVPVDVFRPDHSFACEDARACTFVREDPARAGTPLRTAAGEMIRDEHSGLMCALAPGQTFVSLRAGAVQARVPVTVRGGEGPCIPARFADPEPPVVAATVPDPQPAIVTEPDAPPTVLRPKHFEVAAIPALAPPPIQPAPAPPGGGAPKYEEERESATETAEMTALEQRTLASLERHVQRPLAMPIAGAAIGIAVVALGIAAGRRARPGRSAREARPTPAYAGHLDRHAGAPAWRARDPRRP